MANIYRVVNKSCCRLIPLPSFKKHSTPCIQAGLRVPTEPAKMNNCIPVLYGSAQLTVPYTLTCGQSSTTLLYEADNLDCLPTITVSNSIVGRQNPCTTILVFNIGNGTIIEKELPKNLQPSTGTLGPVFTIGNVKSLYVRCNSDGTDGCAGSVSLTISYCGVNNCF